MTVTLSNSTLLDNQHTNDFIAKTQDPEGFKAVLAHVGISNPPTEPRVIVYNTQLSDPDNLNKSHAELFADAPRKQDDKNYNSLYIQDRVKLNFPRHIHPMIGGYRVHFTMGQESNNAGLLQNIEINMSVSYGPLELLSDSDNRLMRQDVDDWNHLVKLVAYDLAKALIFYSEDYLRADLDLASIIVPKQNSSMDGFANLVKEAINAQKESELQHAA